MRALVVIAATIVGLVGCDGGAGDAGADSTSRFERGVSRVGDKLKTAAENVGTEVNESRIQMVIDNITGMDSVQAEITEDGVVTLVGSVAGDQVKADAERLVRSIEGVRDVRNSLAVGGAFGTPPGGDSAVSSPADSARDSAAR